VSKSNGIDHKAPAPYATSRALEELTTSYYKPPAADELFTIISAETIWPSPKRTVYCTLTGQPWAEVTEAYVKQAISRYGFEHSELSKHIDQIRFFGGPCPEWQTVMPGRLKHNLRYDPTGFAVWALSRILIGEKRNPRRPDDTYIRLIEPTNPWKRTQAKASLYAAILALQSEFVHSFNAILSQVIGEGLIPPPSHWPSHHLEDYSQQEVLQELLTICSTYYTKAQERGSRISASPHSILRRTYYTELEQSSLDEETRKNFLAWRLREHLGAALGDKTKVDILTRLKGLMNSVQVSQNLHRMKALTQERQNTSKPLTTFTLSPSKGA